MSPIIIILATDAWSTDIYGSGYWVILTLGRHIWVYSIADGKDLIVTLHNCHIKIT
jgi:hypothetical protein